MPWSERPLNIWIPNHSHSDGMCRVDKAWFNAEELELLLKSYHDTKEFNRDECGDPKHQHGGTCLLIPEKVQLEREKGWTHFEFKSGCIPFEMWIMMQDPAVRQMLFYKREHAV